MAKKDPFKDFVKKAWPKTKKELEKGMATTKSMLIKGEKHLKDLSEKGIIKAKKISLSLFREKVYYNLGKTIATTPVTKWRTSKKVKDIITEIKILNCEIKKIK